MDPLDQLSPEQAGNISFILTDIDDTMTYRGKLPPEAYAALWKLHDTGLQVVPVTGRPAGWCDLIARLWPVAGVIGENGAFSFFLDGGKMERLYHPRVNADNAAELLDKLKDTVLREIPGSRIAEDQFSRLFDLAIDYREQQPPLDLHDAEDIQRLCEREGARAKISSIHVNAWFGEYDKLSMARIFFSHRYPECDIRNQVLYIGDSPNDEPMFSFFPLSCGVGNIRPYLHLFTDTPAFIAGREGGYGFAEVAERIISLRLKD